MVTHPSPASPADHLIVISRFEVSEVDRAAFLADAEAALEALTAQAGCLAASLGQSTDEASLLLLRTEWAGIGAYRRALSSFDVKVNAVPLLSSAIDEPSAYESIRTWDGSGIVTSESGLAADAGEVRLGYAAGPDIAAVTS